MALYKCFCGMQTPFIFKGMTETSSNLRYVAVCLRARDFLQVPDESGQADKALGSPSLHYRPKRLPEQNTQIPPSQVWSSVQFLFILEPVI